MAMATTNGTRTTNAGRTPPFLPEADQLGSREESTRDPAWISETCQWK